MGQHGNEHFIGGIDITHRGKVKVELLCFGSASPGFIY